MTVWNFQILNSDGNASPWCSSKSFIRCIMKTIRANKVKVHFTISHNVANKD